jgi:hypothetical protein
MWTKNLKQPFLLLGLLAMAPSVYAADAMPVGQVTKPAAEIKWVEPFETAKQAAKQADKPMLVFIGNTEKCPDCQEFIKTVCTKPEFINYAATNLICTRVLYDKNDSREEQLKKSRVRGAFNIPMSHAVIIANADGLRIGELSTAPQSIAAFIQDIKTIIVKAPPEGRLKYSEVSLFDQRFVPKKSYKSEFPEFSSQPLKGRYISLMVGVRLHSWENTRARGHGQTPERDRHTTAIALKMRKAVAEAFPGARMTWAWTWFALNDQEQNYVELRQLMCEFVKEYGDEMTLWPGIYSEGKFNTLEQSKKDLHEGLEKVSQMIGGGYRSKSVVSGHMSTDLMQYLAEHENIHVVQGQEWSQFNVGGQDGDGGIIYPYYASKDHFLKAAQSPRGEGDFVDMVNVDGWTIDFMAGRLAGMGKAHNSRVGTAPIESSLYYGPELGLKEQIYVSDVHFNQATVEHNGYGFLPSIYELSLFAWMNPNYLPNWLRAVKAKYPDTQMLSLGEFGEKWRKHNPDNSRINLKFVQRGNDMPSEEEGRKIYPKYKFHPEIFRTDLEIRWYFNKDFRFATIQNWKENGPRLVMDYTRYNQPYKEPSGNVVERHWDILDIINQKQSRPQDKPKAFAELPADEQAKILNWYPEVKN